MALPPPPSEEEAAQLQAYYEHHTAVAFDLMTLNFAELTSIPALKPAIRAFFDVEEPPTDEAPLPHLESTD